jgi:cell division protein FtsQ
LDVRRVAISGSTSLTAVEVNAATRSAVGDAMLTVNVNGVRESVAAIPAVASVKVSREWPNKIRVTVQERTAVLAVQRSNGWLLVDGAGVPFTTVATRPAKVLPLTVATPSAKDPATQAALAVLTSLPQSVRQRVTALIVPTPAGVQLRLTKGVTVVWGGPEDSPRKARALAALLHRKARVYDVSTPGFVTTSGKPVVVRRR